MSVVLDPPVEGGAEVAPEESPKARGRTGYLLLAPGTVWLLLFFVVPLVTLVSTSLYDPAGTLEKGYQLTFAFGNYVEAIKDYAPEFLRSLLYAGLATVFALLLGYPLAYAIAFKAGRWKSFMLVLVIAPFFTSFLIRTLSWKMLLMTACWRPRRRSCWVSRTTSCRSWCCRCSQAWTRSTAG